MKGVVMFMSNKVVLEPLGKDFDFESIVGGEI